MKHCQHVVSTEHGRFQQNWWMRCSAGCVASLVVMMSYGLAPAQAQDGIPGVPTKSTNPAGPSAADASQAEVPVSGVQHERGYPLDLDAARLMPRAAGPGPSDVENLAPPAEAGPDALAPPLGTQFDGISDTGVIPADPNLAVGRQRIIQVVNSSIRITTRTGASPLTTTLSALLGSPSGSSGLTFDPRVLHDHFANRFVVLALKTNAAKTDSWYLVAVSKTETPTTSQSSWNRYFLRSDIDGSTDTSSWGDYAAIGYDNTNFYITSNQFSPAGSFLRSKIRKYAKAPFYAAGTVSGLEWNNVTDATGGQAFTIQPAITFGVPGHEWLSSVPFGTGNRLNMFRITGSSLFKFSISVGSTDLPSLARQKGSSTGIHSGDNRLLNSVFSNNLFYTCHTVKSGSFPCAARYLGVNATNIIAPAKVLDKVIGFRTADYYYPAVAVNPAGSSTSRICTVFNFSSSTRFAGILYTQMKPDGTVQPLGLAKEGQNTYVKTFGGTRNRWGDYNGIARDPLSSNTFFFNAMYARSTVNTWGTYVASTTVSTTTSPSIGAAVLAGVNPVTRAESSSPGAQGGVVPTVPGAPTGTFGNAGPGPFKSPFNRPSLLNGGVIGRLPVEGRDE